MELKKIAKQEIKRMEEVFKRLRILKKEAGRFMDFSHRYFSDSKYFFENRKFLEAFEACIISWAYIDFALKLGWVSVPEEMRKWFTA